MFRKIYEELVVIRKELQAIRSSMEFNKKCTDKSEEEWNQSISALNRMVKLSKMTN